MFAIDAIIAGDTTTTSDHVLAECHREQYDGTVGFECHIVQEEQQGAQQENVNL